MFKKKKLALSDENAAQVLDEAMANIPSEYHYLIPGHMSPMEKLEYMEKAEKKGHFQVFPYFMWLNKPRGSAPYTGPGTAPGTGKGTGLMGLNEMLQAYAEPDAQDTAEETEAAGSESGEEVDSDESAADTQPENAADTETDADEPQ